MSFNLNCDKCGRFIKKVTAKDIQKMRPNEETVCNPCLKMLEKWSHSVETAGKKAINDINTAVTEASTEFRKVFNDRQIQEGRS